MFDPKLVVVGGDVKTKEIKLKLPTVIGRGRNVSLTLPHPLVSRSHCEITQKNGRLHVRDLGSLNGTFVNNQRIEGENELEPGQLLTIGSVTFRAIYEIPETQELRDTQADALSRRETVGLSDNDTDKISLPNFSPADSNTPVPDEKENSSESEQASEFGDDLLPNSFDPIESVELIESAETIQPENGPVVQMNGEIIQIDLARPAQPSSHQADSKSESGDDIPHARTSDIHDEFSEASSEQDADEKAPMASEIAALAKGKLGPKSISLSAIRDLPGN